MTLSMRINCAAVALESSCLTSDEDQSWKLAQCFLPRCSLWAHLETLLLQSCLSSTTFAAVHDCLKRWVNTCKPLLLAANRQVLTCLLSIRHFMMRLYSLLMSTGSYPLALALSNMCKARFEMSVTLLWATGNYPAALLFPVTSSASPRVSHCYDRFTGNY